MDLYSGKTNEKSEQNKIDKINKCLILGDCMLDRYIWGDVSRISPEAPIPVVNVKMKSDMLGGAGNVAANMKGMGINVSIGTVVGNDESGKKILDLFAKNGIVYDGVVSDTQKTTTKTRIIGKGQQIVRIDEEDVNHFPTNILEELVQTTKNQMSGTSLVVISDYAKGLCTREVCQTVIREARVNGLKVLIDPKGKDWSKYSGAYAITPNWSEFLSIVGQIDEENDSEICQAARNIILEYSIENILITRSEKGMTLVSHNTYKNIPTEAREVVDVSGAGDTVVATLATFLMDGYSLEKAVEISNIAAGIAVEHRGTSVIGRKELTKRLNEKHTVTRSTFNFAEKILSVTELEEEIAYLQQHEKKIVFTNGCFDVLHFGHISYLTEAKKLGDILVVGLNSDASVKKLGKGENRPINKEKCRAVQLAAMEMVDFVVIFGEETPRELIKQLHPDVLVKGGDYCIEQVVGREYVKEVKIIDFVEGYSTTTIINQIKNGMGD